MKKKILIDCDVGVDDALALILACHSPEIEILAVTGVNGNVPLDKVMVNIQKVLTLLRPFPPPIIARGADRPLRGDLVHAQWVHGEDGLGGIHIQPREEWRQVFSGSAAELILRTARLQPGEITLVAIGPLTNLALGLQKDSEGMGQLKEIVIMGGAVREKGNVTPWAEFNFYADPLAAKMVLESGLPITLVPLDVTHQVPLTPEMIEKRVKPRLNPLSQFIIGATGYDSLKKEFRGGLPSFYLHDPLAVGAVVDPGLVRKERLLLSVVTEAGEKYGRVQEVRGKRASGKPEVDVCLGVNRDEFLELFLSRIEG